MDWAEKYRPQHLDEILGNAAAVKQMALWAQTWTSDSAPLLLIGKPGIGKTSAALALARDMNWEVLELNASDARTKAVIERIRADKDVDAFHPVNVGKIIDSTGYKKFFTGGNTNIDAILKGSGPNLAIFMQNLNGYIKAYTTDEMVGYKVENMLMANDLISSIFKFIGNDIIGTITQKDKKKEQSKIQCMVLNLNIENGKTISNRGIAMQTSTANIIIDGSADFGTEQLDISIITVVKEGFRVSNTLTEMIKIKGAMAEPNIIISKDGVINNVAKTAFTTALLGTLTGGVTLITTGLGLITKSWLNNIQADERPCLTAFEGKASKYPEDFSNQIIIKEKLQTDIEKQKKKLDIITNKKIEDEKQKIKSEQ